MGPIRTAAERIREFIKTKRHKQAHIQSSFERRNLPIWVSPAPVSILDDLIRWDLLTSDCHLFIQPSRKSFRHLSQLQATLERRVICLCLFTMTQRHMHMWVLREVILLAVSPHGAHSASPFCGCLRVLSPWAPTGVIRPPSGPEPPPESQKRVPGASRPEGREGRKSRKQGHN